MRKFLNIIFAALTVFMVSCALFEDEEESVTSASFELSEITLGVGETRQVVFNIEPSSCVSSSEVSYSIADGSEIVQISNESSNGCVLTGKKNGSCVLVGKCSGFTSYLQVTVEGAVDVDPYIVTPYAVNVINPGDRISINVSLYNGSTQDNTLFEFSSSDSEVCEIESANNAVIVNAVRKGWSRITVSHPKALYDASVLIYVVPETESVCYITTSQNVVTAPLSDGTQNIKFALAGSVNNDYSRFSYKVKEGSENIEIYTNNNICSVKPVQSGCSVIEVSHPDCEVSLEVQVIVVKTTSDAYIESDGNLVVIDDGTSRIVNCSVKGCTALDDSSRYTFEVSDSSVISVTQVNSSFYIEPLKDGQSRIIVKNEYCTYPYEILAVVENYTNTLDKYYISTSQNVIKAEVGDEVDLSCILIGGNESDRNSFIWTVDDSTVIDFITSSGTVSYSRSADSYDEILDVSGVITCLRTGTASITVSNPKSSCECVVKVRVYEKNTLSDRVKVSGDGIVKVVKGSTESYSVVQTAGDQTSDFEWSTEDSSVAEVYGTGLSSVITGKASGITDLVVNNDLMASPFRSMIVCGTEDEINSASVIYTDDRYMTVYRDETAFKEIKYSGDIDFDDFSLIVSDSDICEARISGNTLIVKGLKAGNTEITVSNTGAENSMTVFVTVYDSDSIDRPYYFTYDRFFGMVNGDTQDLTVTLNGAPESSLDGISWSVEDSSVCEITGNCQTCRITALKEGQTVVTASHVQSSNSAKIVVYVCNSSDELDSKKIITVSGNNFMAEAGESIYVEAFINGDDIRNIEWSADDISVVDVDSNYDSAYIRCLSEGQAAVTVSYSGAVSQKIYISVKSEGSSIEKDISVPSILELVTGSVKTIEIAEANLTDDEISDIEWTADDDSILEIKGNGTQCLVNVLKAGTSEIYVKIASLAIERKILVISADSYEELSEGCYMALSKSWYSIDKGEQADISLVFGTNVPKDEVISGITWTAGDSSVIQLSYNGKNCSVTGLCEGISTVRVAGEGISNALSFTVAVSESDAGDSYYISCDRIVKIVTGNTYSLEAELLNGNGEKINGSGSLFEAVSDTVGLLSVTQADNVFLLTALSSGTGYVTVSHPLCQGSIRVLVCTADTEEALEELWPMSTDKDHYLIGTGKSAVLSLNVIDEDGVSSIRWNCSNTSVCRYEMGTTKKTLTVTGKKAGTCTFTASHTGSDDVVFTVSVSEYGDIDTDVYITGECIIRIAGGSTYDTSIKTNLGESDSRNILWTSSNESIVSCDGSGKECSLTGLKAGWCEVTAKYNSTFYATMIVYVSEDEDSLDDGYFFNVEKRYYYLNSEKTVSIRPYFGTSVPSDISLSVTDVYQNDVISFDYSDDVLKVKGVNEGIGCLRLSNASCRNTVLLYFEVNDEIVSSVTDTDTGYLTAVKTVYVLDAEDNMTPTLISVIPVGIDSADYSSIKWTCDDSSVISVVSDGEKAYVYANKEGETLLKAASVYSSNIISFRIIVSSESDVLIPYISTDVSGLEISAGESSLINCELMNYDGYSITGFSAESSVPSVFSASVTGNVVTVKGLSSGQGILNIKYDDEDVAEKNIVVSVKGIADGIVYLTTDDNYSILSEGSSKTLAVSLNGYDEINSTAFTWEVVEENPETEGLSVISLSGSGNERLCDARNPGIAKIMVSHSSGDNSAVYPVYLYVKVTDYESENPVYISTDNSIVSVTEGNRTTVSVSLVNGDESKNSQFVWTTSSTEVLKISSAGNQCLVQGLEEGIGRISVSHPSCPGLNLDIVVIVEEDTSSDSLYISTDSSLIEMKPTDSYKQINVTLNGGTAEQNTLFSWSILSFESAVKNQDGTSNSVISLSASQDSAIIKPLREGNAIIRVTNSATSHYLDIKVIVSLYNELKFSQSSLTVLQYETECVDVETPTGKTVIYESSDESIATVTGTSKKCIIEGTGAGTCVIRAHTSDGTSTDEIIVSVTKNTSVISDYITTSVNVLNMNATSDVDGEIVKAVLNGSDVSASDSDNIVWKISTEDTSVVKFLGTSSYTATGSEIRIVPVSSGECSVVLSHSKAVNDKVIYISVEQDNVTLKVSSDYIEMGVNDKDSLTASLANAGEVETENIVWKSLDTGVVTLYGADSSGCVYGDTAILMSQKAGEAIVTCSYGSLSRNVTVFVTEEPFISFPEGSRIIGINQEIEVKLNVNPPEYYSQVEISTTSSIYCTVTKRLDDENMACYVTIKGTSLEGKCTITAELQDLVSTMDVTVTDDVTLKMMKAVLYQTDGSYTETMNPGSLWMNNDCQKIRCYYRTSPSGIKFDNEERVYKKSDLFDGTNTVYPRFPASDIECFSLSFGTDDSEESYPDYFELTPINCFYGTLRLENYDQNITMDVPVCSSYETFSPQFMIIKNKKSSFDEANSVINLAKGETIQLMVNDSSLPEGMQVEYVFEPSLKNVKVSSGTISYTETFAAPSDNSKRQSTSYAGTLTVKVLYPKFCDVYGTYKKVFIVNTEEWY